MSSLPIREMVLYKHGVGFFVRAGQISGENVTLTFHKDDVNDILKSLAIFDRAGGQILGVDYQTPITREDRLANSSIDLTDYGRQRELIRDLSGRNVVLRVEVAPGATETFTGRLIGLDERSTQSEAAAPDLVVAILVGQADVRFFPLQSVRGVELQDAQAIQDLRFFLDTIQFEDNRREIAVRLSEGDHDLVVNYVAPAPTWRVSYRLVGQTETESAGKAILQGWGLFDNRLQEDLDQVRLTLVAGQPISFIYNLYESNIPERPVIEDEARVAPGPIEFEGSPLGRRVDDFLEASPKGRMLKRSSLGGGVMAPAMYAMPEPEMERAISLDEMRQTAPAAEGKSAGETFQYVVTAPVSVKRGSSALVPILGVDITYQREYLYNGAKLPLHPVAAMRFVNASDLTLERGPVTVVEDGDYKGEAIIPFTKTKGEVYVPYAVELGVKVTERSQSTTETVGLRIQDAYLVHEQYQIEAQTYILENTTDKPVTVTIEAPIGDAAFELFSTPKPDVETATDRRWKVAVQAFGKTEFVRKARKRTYRREELRRLNMRNLQSYLRQRWLDQATFGQLEAVLSEMAGIEALNGELNQLKAERNAIFEQQKQQRETMSALKSTGDEAALRSRILTKIAALQDRLDAIENQEAAARQQITEKESRIDQLIDALNPDNSSKKEQ